tara:strand:- start:154 stop:474 length:321 start_codon:yes stop_codon:yes gene_type:complete
MENKKRKFQSAEQMAMHDISQYLRDKAEDISKEPSDQRYRDYCGIWLDTVSQIVGSLFICPSKLKTKKNRYLNRLLGLHKINKKDNDQNFGRPIENKKQNYGKKKT